MKKKFYSLVVLLFTIVLLYSYSSIKNNDYITDWLSIVEQIIICIILFYTYKKVAYYRASWFMIFMACFSWLICECIWIYYTYVLCINPVDEKLFLFMYLVPNICIFISVFIYFIKVKNRWNSIQLVLDIFSILVISSFIIFNLFFVKYMNFFNEVSAETVINIVYNLSDCLTVSMVLVVLISSLKFSKHQSLKLLALGIVVLTVGDLIYSYQSLNNIYIANNISDVTFLFSLVVFACAGLNELYMPTINNTKDIESNNYENLRNSKLPLILIILPFILWVLNLCNVKDAIFLVIVILVNYVITIYINIFYKNALLIRRQDEQNESLEKIVLEKTKELIDLNNNLAELVKKDFLTDLTNRRFFVSELDRIIKELPSDKTIAVFFIDLDRFKAINDSYGHEMGDSILIEISKRIKHIFEKDSIAARLGGDKFVIAVSNLTSQGQIVSLAQKIVNEFNKLIIINNYEFRITSSIGISVYPIDAEDRITLMRNCDIAMYRAKEMGFNRYKFYNKKMNEDIMGKLRLELLLRKAVYNEEFELYYQPEIDIKNNKLVGAEALIRWNPPGKDMISPDEFIPIAEEIGVIVPLGQWVLENALRQVKIWNEKFGLELFVGVNISPKQFDSLRFIENLKKTVSSLCIPSKWLDIEITEACAMKNGIETEKKIREINNFGIRISIDDFGTGYSSFGYLKRYSVDRIKIDKELVNTIAEDYNEFQIIKAIIAMSKALELKVIAEGVESIKQIEKLKELDCDQVQGYYYSKPIKAAEFEKYIEKNSHLYDE